jgi:hypothetical protein
MNRLETLALDDIRLVTRWTLAPAGSLLQMIVDGETVIGMRTSYQVANGTPDALVILAGERVGQVMTEITGPALDVSEAVEIIVIDPMALSPSSGQIVQHGVVLTNPSATGLYFVWLMLGKGHGAGGLCIASQTPSLSYGSCYPALDQNKLVIVGAKVGVRLKERKNSN